jgi:hypothetical protein
MRAGRDVHQNQHEFDNEKKNRQARSRAGGQAWRNERENQRAEKGEENRWQ